MERKEIVILHVDDEDIYTDHFSQLFAGDRSAYSFRYEGVHTSEAFFRRLHDLRPDCVLLDMVLGRGDSSGQEVLEELRGSGYQGLIVVTSNSNDPAMIRDCLAGGANDFALKGTDDHELPHRLIESLEQAASSSTIERDAPADLVGATARRVWYTLRRIMASAVPAVLVRGESGVGKEGVARCLRALLGDKVPLVTVNCAAIAKDLVEAELFGYVKGAFSGATAAKDGFFKAASDGWVFLDEVACLSLHCQAALLRTLECGEVRPVGANQTFQVNVRIVAATNEDLDAMVADGRFRGDLLQRLRAYEIALPPLRERPPEEREEILAALLARMNEAQVRKGEPRYQISKAAQHLLLSAQWRAGNIREMRHTLLAASVNTRGHVITPSALPPSFYVALQETYSAATARPLPLPPVARRLEIRPPEAAAAEPVRPPADVARPRPEERSQDTAPARVLAFPAADELRGRADMRFDTHMAELEANLLLKYLEQVAASSPLIVSSQRRLAAALGLTRYSFITTLRRIAAVRRIPDKFAHLLAQGDSEER